MGMMMTAAQMRPAMHRRWFTTMTLQSMPEKPADRGMYAHAPALAFRRGRGDTVVPTKGALDEP
jgi:hypothetical protein